MCWVNTKMLDQSSTPASLMGLTFFILTGVLMVFLQWPILAIPCQRSLFLFSSGGWKVCLGHEYGSLLALFSRAPYFLPWAPGAFFWSLEMNCCFIHGFVARSWQLTWEPLSRPGRCQSNAGALTAASWKADVSCQGEMLQSWPVA